MSTIDYSAIKRSLESQRCSKHNEHPKVTVTGDKVNISACCDEFRSKLTVKFKDLIGEAAQKSISDSFKKFLK